MSNLIAEFMSIKVSVLNLFKLADALDKERVEYLRKMLLREIEILEKEINKLENGKVRELQEELHRLVELTNQ
jgi:uncharacterized membrane protein